MSSSTEEVFDVVDAADVVIGTATRGEVHANGWRHRAVHILVFNNTGELYLQRRSLAKDSSPGLWDTSAAGHVESNESYTAAAGRELHEELGLARDTALEPLFKIEASEPTGFEFVHVYRCVATGRIRPDPDEIMEGLYIAPADLSDWIGRSPALFTTTFREICAKLNWFGGCDQP